MTIENWNPFPHDATEFTYRGAELGRHWNRLHAGDRVAFPDADWVEERITEGVKAGDSNASSLSEQLQDAWRAFHSGNFADAVREADQVGVLGSDCACKAIGIYATYLASDDQESQALFRDAIARSERAVAALPGVPGSHYFHAFSLGRLGQSISIAEALRKGMAGQIQGSLDACLELEPDHAEAHTAYGMYHAEIIAKVGKFVGGMTYGASADRAIEHFETAIGLAPLSPIAQIEYANGLYLLFGEKRLEDVTDLYIKASEMTPVDAMERLDIDAALAELE